VPAHLTHSPLNTPDDGSFEGVMHPGAPLADAPVQRLGQDSWLLDHTGGRFVLLIFAPTADNLASEVRQMMADLARAPIPVHTLLLTEHDGAAPAGATVVVDHLRRACERLDGRPGTGYLLRPDQHVAARWRSLQPAAVLAALARATCNA